MEEPHIDALLRDIVGDDSFKNDSDEIKFTLAVLIFIYQRDLAPGWGSLATLAELDLPPMNVEAALQKCRDVGILNSSNRFRSGKDMDSGITWILLASVLKRSMRISFKDDYAYSLKKGSVRRKKWRVARGESGIERRGEAAEPLRSSAAHPNQGRPGTGTGFQVIHERGSSSRASKGDLRATFLIALSARCAQQINFLTGYCWLKSAGIAQLQGR
jgi:hypothetical protein